VQGLVTQCKALEVVFVDALPKQIHGQFEVILDAIFGFSFTGSVRSPFDKILKELNASKVPIAAVDIPSGWDVDKGNVTKEGLDATLLISLTAPKLCAKFFTGPHHFLGGRFIPPKVDKIYELNLPPYTGTEQCVALKSNL